MSKIKLSTYFTKIAISIHLLANCFSLFRYEISTNIYIDYLAWVRCSFINVIKVISSNFDIIITSLDYLAVRVYASVVLES